MAAWRASGQSKAAFCRANDIRENRLDYWLQRGAGPRSTTALIPVRVREPDSRGAAVRVSGCGISADVYDTGRVDPRWLVALLAASRAGEP